MNQDNEQKRAPKRNVDYQNGKIYKIVNNINDIVYIGSTATTLSRRFTNHKATIRTSQLKFYKDMNELGSENFKILLIENYPCKDRNELEKREYEILKTYPTDKVYNLKFDTKHSEEIKRKMKITAPHLGKIGEDSIFFKRGCIRFEVSQNRYRFQWHENKKKKIKSFALSKYNTPYDAYLAAVEFRAQIYPLPITEEEKQDNLNNFAELPQL